MNKKIIVLLLFVVNFMLYECTTSKGITYDLPAHISKKEKKQLIGEFKKGKVLYKIHCSECHGIFTNGKESVPDFSKPQLYTYKIVLLNKDKNTHKSASNISPLQLDYILTFLMYKKTEKPNPQK